MADKYVDVKVTTWKRYHFDSSIDIEVLINIMNGKDSTTNDIISSDLGFTESETLYELEEELTPESNNGHSTIEIYSNSDLVWENGLSN